MPRCSQASRTIGNTARRNPSRSPCMSWNVDETKRRIAFGPDVAVATRGSHATVARAEGRPTINLSSTRRNSMNHRVPSTQRRTGARRLRLEAKLASCSPRDCRLLWQIRLEVEARGGPRPRLLEIKDRTSAMGQFLPIATTPIQSPRSSCEPFARGERLGNHRAMLHGLLVALRSAAAGTVRPANLSPMPFGFA